MSDAKTKRPARPPAPPPPGAAVLKLEEVAHELRCSVATVRRLIHAGKLKRLPNSPSGAAVVVRRVDLEEYLSAAAYEPKAEAASAAPAVHPRRVALGKAGWDGVDRLAARGKGRGAK